MLGKGFIAAMKKLHCFTKEFQMTKRKGIAAAGIIIVVFCVFFLFNYKNANTVDALAVKTQDYTEKIVAVGQLQLAKETTLIAEVSGEIISITAEAGDIISAGAVIISIEDLGYDFQLEQMKANYNNANAEYENLLQFDYASAKEELVSQATKTEQAQKAFQAAEKLYLEGALSQIEYLEYKFDYEATLLDWNTAKLKVQSLSEGGALRKSAYAKLQSAQSSYESALNDQNKYRITVPWNSVLLKTYISEHDSVQPGDSLADIGEAGSYHVVAELDEKYFPYLSEGMRARISLGDASTGKGAEGTIDVISRKINEETGTFEIKIALPEEFPYHASDLTVNVEIIIVEREDVTVIPSDYLINDKSAVYLYQNGTAVETRVKYEGGLSSKLLILNGLAAGDIIIKPGPTVQEGSTVNIDKGVEGS